jgi:hypothetical protein
MAGSLVIPNQFQNQSGPIPLSQLDADFTAVVNSVNNALTYSNYYQDTSGAANALVVTVPAPTVFTYTAGTTLLVKVANTNTGATTINVNGLGTVNVLSSSLGALGSGQLVSGGIYPLFFDGTQFQLQTQATSITSGQITAALGYTAGYINIPQNVQTSAYVAAATDVGKCINISTGGVTVNTGVFSQNDVFMVYNASASSQTITQGSGVTMYFAGTATTGNRTLAQRGVCSVMCVATNTFVVSGAGLT